MEPKRIDYVPWQIYVEMICYGLSCYTFSLSEVVLFDSGAKGIHALNWLIDEMGVSWGAVPMLRNRLEMFPYMVNCSAKISLDVKIGGKFFTVDSESLILTRMPLPVGFCPLHIHYYKKYNFGNPFGRSCCHIHDVRNRRIGFQTPLRK